MGTRSTHATRMPHQLSLPFSDQESGSACLQPALPPLLPQHVWTSLSPTTRLSPKALLSARTLLSDAPTRLSPAIIPLSPYSAAIR